jgi:O-antigen/teichoic acid export membrane protein
MPKKLLKNASFSTASQIVNMAVSILFVPAYIHFLGINGYGIYSFLLLFFSWVTILQAGIDPAVIRITAKYIAENNYTNINPLLTASMIFQIITASLIGGAFILSSDFLATFIIKNEVGFLNETRVALHYAGINIVILMCRNVYIALFMGLQRYDISSFYDALFNLLASLLALLALWIGYGIVGMIVVRLIINILSVAVLHYVAKRLVSSFRLSLRISKELLKEIYNYASWIVAGRVNRLAVNALPPILIGMYIGPSGIAYFNISSRIVSALNNLLASSVNVIFPFVSELKTLKETGRIKSAYLGANRFLSLISAPLYCFGVIYSWDLLYFWLGPDVANNCWILMGIFFIGYYLSSSTMIPSIFALGIGAVKILAFTGFAQTIIVILTLPFLLKTFGIIGAGLNLILFESASIVMVIIITTKIIKASNFTFWVRDRLLMLLVSAVIFAVFIPLKGLLSHVPLTRVEMAGYLGCVFLVGLSIYGFIIKNSMLIDLETKKRIVNMFLKTG